MLACRAESRVCYGFLQDHFSKPPGAHQRESRGAFPGVYRNDDETKSLGSEVHARRSRPQIEGRALMPHRLPIAYADNEEFVECPRAST